MLNRFDYVIVGAGSAGCVLANRLTACGNYSVCLLEAGPVDNSKLFSIPGAFPLFMFSKKYNWRYAAKPDSTVRNGEPLFVPRGKCLGGSSSTNAMAHVRGQRQDYDQWAAAGNDGWDYQSLLPYFKRAETFAKGGDSYRGDTGPIYVDEFPLEYPVSEKFLEASASVGHRQNQDFNGEDQEGVCIYQYNIKEGERCSTSRAYLKPAMSRPNLTVIVNAQAHAIQIEDKQASGVRFSSNGKAELIRAQREVIVSAGAIDSPKLLQLSGIGRGDHLAKVGITCLHELPGVGENLQEHVDACVLVESVKNDGLTTSVAGIASLVPDLFRYWQGRRGKLAPPLIEVGGFIRSGKEAARPDIQLGLVPVLFDDNGRDLKLMSKPGYSCHVCVLRPASRGHVRVKSTNPGEAPIIDFNFFSDSGDRKVLIDGVKKVREIFAAPAFDSHRGEEIQPGANVLSDEDIFEQCRQRLGTVFHPVGTCKMGKDEAAVVDSSLRVHGIERLRVVDASIMPSIPSDNTNAPTIAIAERAADLILNCACCR